jgi:hypothetical protein
MPGYPAPAPCSYFAMVTLMTSILRPKEVAPEARSGGIGVDPLVAMAWGRCTHAARPRSRGR